MFEEKYDLAILGGDPAGTACALSLRESGLRITVIDRQKFPKDKVCGDAIPGEAIKTLKNIIPDFDIEFGLTSFYYLRLPCSLLPGFTEVTISGKLAGHLMVMI